MADTIDVQVPDIGDFIDVPVIEVLVKPGDTVKKNDSIVTLESEKASMEVPSPSDGVIADVKVGVGDKVSKGSVVLTLRQDSSKHAEPVAAIDLVVPDIGDFQDVPVIEVLVHPGDVIAKDASLVTLESEKATMEVPASAGGTIRDVRIKPGDKVSKGDVIATLSSENPRQPRGDNAVPQVQDRNAMLSEPKRSEPNRSEPERAEPAEAAANGAVHASPSIRRFARELGVDLHRVSPSGPNRRVTRDDVQRFVKSALADGGATAVGTSGLAIAPWPKIDFAQFGEIERAPLSRIKRISAANLHRNWVTIPHVTQNEDADVTDLEQFRQDLNAEAGNSNAKVTMLAFLIAASIAALKTFSQFNSSLDGEELVLKKYYHIGFAADTPAGLVVPVVRDADRKGIRELARETAQLAGKAREGKLSPSDMQGGTFTISSLGSIGGTYFTPIINAPEVAILGACRAATHPVWNGTQFVPRLVQPLSLSYDHRVIDGAAAARFTAYLAAVLRDLRRALL